MPSKLTVVIPAHEANPVRLRRVVAALRRCDPAPAEILCVDDHSPASIRSTVIELGARYLLTTSRRQSPHVAHRALARQIGLEAASQPRVLFLDSDILVPPHLFGRIEKVLDRRGPRALVFAPRQDVRDSLTLTPRRSASPRVEYAGYTAGVRQPAWARQSSHCFAVDREFIQSVGGWDTAFTGWGEEDTELFYRLWLEGGKFVVLRRTHVGHLRHAVDHEANRTSFARNAAYFVAKHPEVARARAGFYRRQGIAFLPLSASERGRLRREAPRISSSSRIGIRERPMPVRNIVLGQGVSPEKVARARQLRRQMTRAETLIWERVRANRVDGLRFRRQQVIDGFIADFYSHAAGLIIEIDGPIHDGRADYDAERDRIFQQRGLKVLRFTNDAITADIEGIIQKISDACKNR